MTPTLPPPLAAALNRWHDRAAARMWVRALEAQGVQVAVRRLQLGDPRAAGFGEVTEVYRTRERESDGGNANQ